MNKKVFFGIGVIVLVMVAVFWDLVSYGFNQASGQASVIWKARPIEEVLQDSTIADSLKLKIRLIQEVRRFAVDSIGLEESDNYTTFYNQEGKTTLWNLSACKPYLFEPKTWSFPFLGSFPYKGFFDLEKAKNELKELEVQGYDARIRSVGGWSTLGWFKDPILSNMLERTDGSLSELIIHELTHSTLFVKNDVVFNENLASFIGERGAVLFLKSKFGASSKELDEYTRSEQDSKAFTGQMLLAAAKLDSLYISFTERTSDSTKFWSKHLLIDQITTSLDTMTFHNKRYYDIFKLGRPNNAYFMSYLRYHSSEDSLSNILHNEYDDELSRFIQGMKQYHE